MVINFIFQVAKTMKGEVQKDEHRFQLFHRHDSPISLNFPNQRGIEGYDPEMHINEIIATLPGALKEHTEVVCLLKFVSFFS